MLKLYENLKELSQLRDKIILTSYRFRNEEGYKIKMAFSNITELFHYCNNRNSRYKKEMVKTAVTEDERRLIENALAKNEQIYSDVVYGKEIFCPVWRVRLHKLGRGAQDVIRQVIFGLDADVDEPKAKRPEPAKILPQQIGLHTLKSIPK